MNLNHVRRFLCSRRKGGKGKSVLEPRADGKRSLGSSGFDSRLLWTVLDPTHSTAPSQPPHMHKELHSLNLSKRMVLTTGVCSATLATGDGIPRGICSQQSVYGMPSDK